MPVEWPPTRSPRANVRYLFVWRRTIEQDDRAAVSDLEVTVKVHIKAILRKTRLRNRTQAAILAIESGFRDPPFEETSSVVIADAANLSPALRKANGKTSAPEDLSRCGPTRQIFGRKRQDSSVMTNSS